MSELVQIPEVLPIAPFPALGSSNYNQEAYANGVSVPPAIDRMREIALAARTIALGVRSDAQATAQDRQAAAASAQAAAGSAQAASADAQRLAALDALWLGAQQSDPVKGRNGAALIAGNAYVNSVTGKLRAYTGTAWVQALDVIAGVVSLSGQTGALSVKTINGQSLLGEGVLDISSAAVVALSNEQTTIDCSAGVYFSKAVSASQTVTFANPPAAGRAFAFALELNHSGGTIAWPASVRWVDDAAPALMAGRSHLLVFVTDDGGARWRALISPNYLT